VTGKLHSKSSCAQCPSPWAFAEIFPGLGASRPFAYPLQVVDDAAQIDIHKTLPSFYTIKQMPIVTATVAYRCFPLRKFYTKQMFVFVKKNAFCWQQCFFFTHVSLHIV